MVAAFSLLRALTEESNLWPFFLIALGIWFFNRAAMYREKGQWCFSRSRAYRIQRGYDVPDEIPTRPQNKRLINWGTFLTAGSGIPYTLGLFTVVDGLRPMWSGIWHDGNWHDGLGDLVRGVAFLAFANIASRLGIRLRERVISSPQDVASLPYVLYLRSFAIDHDLARQQRYPSLTSLVRGLFLTIGLTEEGRLAHALRWAGPMVAVGRPQEDSPRTGAHRMYLPQGGWQEPVRELIKGARLTVIMLGQSPGTLWEIGEALRILPPERLILLVPFDKRGYDRFRRAAEELQPPDLPDYVAGERFNSRIKGLIYFTPDWQAKFVPFERPPRIEEKLMGAVDRAMWPAVLQLTQLEDRSRKAKG